MANIDDWNIEDEGFWKKTGKKIANRNLWISIPNLLLSFAVWIMWSIIAVRMRQFGYNFGLIDDGMDAETVSEKLKEINNLYYSLPAIAGLVGATLRIPNSFLIAIGGGRNVIFITSALLLIPCIGVGLALRDLSTSYMVFAFLAALSGFGGGNFASSMSNISYFFPKRMQGTALGLNAGIGNLGVGVMQKLLPFTMGLLLFGAVNGNGELVHNEAFAGLQNAGWTWIPLLVITVIAAYFGMNNLKSATPEIPSTAGGIGKSLFLISLGLLAGFGGAFLMVGIDWATYGMEGIAMWLVLPLVVLSTVLMMKYLSPKAIQGNLNRQFAIFKDKHNWIMTVIYTMTFGSFIGFSNAFPKLCQDIFVFSDAANPEYANPNAPDYLLWVFFGPMLGALVRPVGGWLSDKVNSGSLVTQWATIAQIAATVGVALVVVEARESATPEDYWWPFFALFMVLFLTTGIGNGSTFRSVPYIFSKELAGPVLGWTSAIAAYGAFIIPIVFGAQIKAGTPELALYGFAAYYVICLGLNWWFYQRKGSGIKC
jgi:NNP family nitrate/nitrite transporter-like MFS transporter